MSVRRMYSIDEGGVGELSVAVQELLRQCKQLGCVGEARSGAQHPDGGPALSIGLVERTTYVDP